MKSYIEINLEENYPTVKEAISLADEALQKYKSITKTLVFIHGYGSSGIGGKIQSSLRTHLKTLKEKKMINDFIFGERYGMFDEASRNLNQKNKDLSLYYNKGNNGITIVLL